MLHSDTYGSQKRNLKEKKPIGTLIPIREDCDYRGNRLGVIGNREFLEALKSAIEEALETGVDRTFVHSSKGTSAELVVKLEEEGKLTYDEVFWSLLFHHALAGWSVLKKWNEQNFKGEISKE